MVPSRREPVKRLRLIVGLALMPTSPFAEQGAKRRCYADSLQVLIDFPVSQAYLRGVAASVRVPTTTLGLDHASSGSVSLAPSVSGRVV